MRRMTRPSRKRKTRTWCLGGRPLPPSEEALAPCRRRRWPPARPRASRPLAAPPRGASRGTQGRERGRRRPPPPPPLPLLPLGRHAQTCPHPRPSPRKRRRRLLRRGPCHENDGGRGGRDGVAAAWLGSGAGEDGAGGERGEGRESATPPPGEGEARAGGGSCPTGRPRRQLGPPGEQEQDVRGRRRSAPGPSLMCMYFFHEMVLNTFNDTASGLPVDTG